MIPPRWFLRATWDARFVAAFPAYGEYPTRTRRTIPVVILEPR